MSRLREFSAPKRCAGVRIHRLFEWESSLMLPLQQNSLIPPSHCANFLRLIMRHIAFRRYKNPSGSKRKPTIIEPSSNYNG